MWPGERVTRSDLGGSDSIKATPEWGTGDPLRVMGACGGKKMERHEKGQQMRFSHIMKRHLSSNEVVGHHGRVALVWGSVIWDERKSDFGAISYPTPKRMEGSALS